MARPRILAVEDDEIWVKVIQRSLRDFAAQIVVVNSLADARQAIATMRLDVALVDLQLSDAEPKETFQFFNVAAEKMPVVVLTGSWASLTQLREQRREIDDFLIKEELDSKLLKTVVTSAIRKWHALQ